MKSYLIISLLILLVSLNPGKLSATAHFDEDQSESKVNARIELLLKEVDNNFYRHPNQSLQNAKLAYQLADSINNAVQLALALNKIGTAYWILGDLINAMDHINRSLRIANETGDKVIQAMNKVSLGAIYSASGEHLLAIELYKESLPVLNENEINDRLIGVYNNTGKAYLETNYFDSADRYLHKSLLLSREFAPQMQPIILFNIADNYLRQGKYEQAENYIDRCEEQARNFNDLRAKIRVLQTKAEILLNHEEIEQAYFLAQKAVELAEDIQIRELRYITYGTMSNVWVKLQNFDSAYHYLYLSYSIRDSLQNTQIRNKLSLSNFQKSQNELSLLRQINLNSELRATNQQYTIIGMFLIIVLSMALILFVFISKARENKAHKKLEGLAVELAEQKKELEELNQFKISLFGMVAHDIRSPLQSIHSLIELMKLELISKEEILKLIPEVEKRLENLNRLMSNILDWAKVSIQERGNILRLEPVNMKRMVSEVIESVELLTSQKQISIETNISHGLVVTLDKPLISTVLRNLISNAIKFSKKRSIIIISVEKGDKEAVFSVIDQGIGMDDKTAQELFNYDIRSHRGTSGEKGSGFGLRLCKDFIEIHEGNIWAESMKGEGSTFYFSIPVADTIINKQKEHATI